MGKVEFVSYDGEWPCLCVGTLVLKIDGEERVIPRGCMVSGGSVYFDEDWNAHVEEGRWEVVVPNDLLYLEEEIANCVNENVPYGCCGGCI